MLVFTSFKCVNDFCKVLAEIGSRDVDSAVAPSAADDASWRYLFRRSQSYRGLHPALPAAGHLGRSVRARLRLC